jgi:hypothetical protein
VANAENIMADDIPHFEGEVETRWLIHGGADREMELLREFVFVDSTGYRWVAHPGEKVDGASIPQQVWTSVVGTPFIGDCRRATVVHDVACDRHEKTSREAHRMFYEAMLADGTVKERALMFYAAVRLFGPQWDDRRGFRPMLAARAQDIDFDRLETALSEALGEPPPVRRERRRRATKAPAKRTTRSHRGLGRRS